MKLTVQYKCIARGIYNSSRLIYLLYMSNKGYFIFIVQFIHSFTSQFIRNSQAWGYIIYEKKLYLPFYIPPFVEKIQHLVDNKITYLCYKCCFYRIP